MPTTASIYRPLIGALALFAALAGVIGVHARPAGAALPAGLYGSARFFGTTSAVVVTVEPDDVVGSRLSVFVGGGGVSCSAETSTLGVTTDPPGTTAPTVDPLLRNGYLPRTTLPCVADAGDRVVGRGGVYRVVIEVQWTENGQLQTSTAPAGMSRNQVATLLTFGVSHPDGVRSVTPSGPRSTAFAYLSTLVYAGV